MVTLANGSTTIAKRIGRATLVPSLPLKSVLYVPGCPLNLISISKLAQDLNCSVTFLNHFVVV